MMLQKTHFKTTEFQGFKNILKISQKYHKLKYIRDNNIKVS